MSGRWLWLYLGLLAAQAAFAEEELVSRFGVGVGYRADKLDWNIAGDLSGANPNVLSELTWSGLGAYMLDLDARFLVYDRFYFRGRYGTGAIVKGRNQDSDYLGDDRSQEFSRTNNDADAGRITQYSLAAGYQLSPNGGRTKIIPQVGYAQLDQDLRMRNGFQTLDPLGLFGGVGPFSGLDSKYDAEWKGPFVGVELEHQADPRLTLYGSAQYHQVDYRGTGDFNLRQDLAHPVSFLHEADASGVTLSLGGRYALTERLRLNGRFDYQRWRADPGLDHTFFADGSTASTRLNEVNSDSRGVFLGVEYQTP